MLLWAEQNRYSFVISTKYFKIWIKLFQRNVLKILFIFWVTHIIQFYIVDYLKNHSEFVPYQIIFWNKTVMKLLSARVVLFQDNLFPFKCHCDINACSQKSCSRFISLCHDQHHGSPFSAVLSATFITLLAQNQCSIRQTTTYLGRVSNALYHNWSCGASLAKF